MTSLRRGWIWSDVKITVANISIMFHVNSPRPRLHGTRVTQHTRRRSLGSGGCVAVALSKLKLFASAATAKQALNTQLATYSAKCRPDYRVPEHVGIADDHWHPEVVKMAVVEANFHFHKLDLDSVDLATEL